MSVDVGEIKGRHDLIEEINEVVGVWEIWIEECPINPIKVKVIHFYPQDMYMGVANYSIQNPNQAGPYKSLHQLRTAQEALEDAIQGFLMFYDEKLKDQIKFVRDEDF